jgi:hypothetical protein
MAERKSKKVRKKLASAQAATQKKAKLGTGKRFSALKKSIAASGAKDPGAVAAAIGRKKFGAKKFAKLGQKGKK